jgi:hypothetical protein
MAAFATVADVEERSPSVYTPDEYQQVLVILEEVSDEIRAATGQTITQVVGDVVTLEGNGRRLLQLPQIPVTAVASVVIDGVTQVVNVDYTWNAKGVLRALCGRWPVWPVVVTYTHGYTTVPDPIKRLTAKLAAERISTDSSISQESVAGYSVTYRDPADLLSVHSGLLDQYMPVFLP